MTLSPIVLTLVSLLLAAGGALAGFAVVWTLRYCGVTGSTLPLADSARTYLVVSLDAQVGGAGTVSAQVTSVTWTDLT